MCGGNARGVPSTSESKPDLKRRGQACNSATLTLPDANPVRDSGEALRLPACTSFASAEYRRDASTLVSRVAIVAPIGSAWQSHHAPPVMPLVHTQHGICDPGIHGSGHDDDCDADKRTLAKDDLEETGSSQIQMLETRIKGLAVSYGKGNGNKHSCGCC